MKFLRKLRIRDQCIRELLSEMLGTFVLTLFSVASGAQYVLGGKDVFSSFLTVNIANGFGVTMAIYVSGGASGGMVNPAVSLAWCLTGRLPWRRLIFHLIGQVVGAFIAACLVFGVYWEAIEDFDKGNRQLFGAEGTAGIFAFFPREGLSSAGGLLDSIVGTGMLILCILALVDPRNMAPHKGFVPVAVGLSVLVIGATFGMNCGYPINPARDLGPRLFLLVAGWGTEVFSYRDYNWFWVPLVGPIVGCVLFTAIYTFLVQLHWLDEDDVTELEVEVSSLKREIYIQHDENGKGQTNNGFSADDATKF